MMTVKEISKLTGVSIRTLQYYDKIGLLPPTGRTESGYRLYDDTALETLQQILLFRELEFPLKEIKQIISRPDFDKDMALEQQIALLTMKKEHLEKLIDFARAIRWKGIKTMDFTVFDTTQIKQYAKQAKEKWGKTAEYQEYEQKSENRSAGETQGIAEQFMQIFSDFGKMKDTAPASADAQALVEKLQAYITQNFYHCSKDMLRKLGQMYAEDEAFRTNIDRAGGEGTAQFAAEAISIYCNSCCGSRRDSCCDSCHDS